MIADATTLILQHESRTIDDNTNLRARRRETRVRILYHHRTQGRGAEGNHIVSIVTALRSLGHEVDVLSPPGVDPFNAGSVKPDEASSGHETSWSRFWRTVSLKMPKWLFELAEMAYNLPAWFRLRSALRSKPYDIVYERYAAYLVAGSLAARQADCEFLLEVNDVSGVDDRVRPQVFPRACAWVERRLIARCERVHAVSSYLGERLIETGLPSNRLVVAPNGFEVASIRLTASRQNMRRKFGLDDSLVLGFAGWFVGWDRLDFLVDVFKELHQSYPQMRLCLVGDGEPLAEIKRTLHGTPLERLLVHTGPVPRGDVCNYIQMFDIGILPHSNLFGSPMIMFEMMALRMPIVAPKLPPIEDVQRDEQTALLFAPLNSTDCLRQVSRLADSAKLRRSLAESAYQTLVQDHSWKRTAEKIISGLNGEASEYGKLPDAISCSRDR